MGSPAFWKCSTFLALSYWNVANQVSCGLSLYDGSLICCFCIGCMIVEWNIKTNISPFFFTAPMCQKSCSWPMRVELCIFGLWEKGELLWALCVLCRLLLVMESSVLFSTWYACARFLLFWWKFQYFVYLHVRLTKVREEDSNLYFNAKSTWRWCEFSAHPRVMIYTDRTGAELTDFRVSLSMTHITLEKETHWLKIQDTLSSIMIWESDGP